MHGSRPNPVVTIERFGAEREPVVVIDGFSGRIGELSALGRAASYQEEPMYPGLRSPADRGYLDPLLDTLEEIARRVFGITAIAVTACDFSIVSRAPETLIPAQRIPHHDHTGPDLIALLHYTQGAETGGTAFYRQRRTGFETIRPERVAIYDDALMDDEAQFGPPAPGYFAGDDERYQCIGRIDARPDRAILYRGRTLHSGIIPQAPHPADATANGRLTINTFLTGESERQVQR